MIFGKKYIVSRVASITNFPKKDVEYIFDVIFNVILDIFKKMIPGDSMVIKRFGVFKVILRKPRLIKIGKPIYSPWYKIIIFRLSSLLKKNFALTEADAILYQEIQKSLRQNPQDDL